MIQNINPPIAKKKSKILTAHSDERVDNYFWLNDREDPEVLDYLKAENNYYESKTAHQKDFQKALFEEMKSRIKEDDTSVPYKYNGYWYVTKFEKGKDYPIYTRKKDHLEANEEVLFDCNVMAKGHTYFKLVGLSISPDNTKITYGVDTTGRRQYTLFVKNLKTNHLLKTIIENTTGSSTWANDNETFFYTKKDPTTLRAHQIFKHSTSNTTEDTLIYDEQDDTFGATVYKTKSKQYIVIACYSTLTDEYWILDADTPHENFRIFQPRERGLEYNILHYQDHFYILTNANGAYNFKLMKTSVLETSKAHWEDIVPHRADVLLEGVDIFKDYLVISERQNGLNTIRIKRWDNNQAYELPFDSETYTAYTTTNLDFDTQKLRYSYNSFTQPAAIIDFDMLTQKKTILKEQAVLGETFKKDHYESERIWALAEDGTKIPMSIVYKKGIERNGKNPVLQYAYGSYGSTVDPYFSSIRLSLLDRGFIYVLSHIRGGDYLGRPWYEDGKLLNKKNTFSDFIACSRHLIEKQYTSPQHLYAMGGSAGGLLMGVITNDAPELYNGIVAAVPFVDVLTTMLNDAIPLTTGEYDEWGNPNEKLFYEYMKSYSPYENITSKAFPNLLVTTGLHDSQVQYWEPAKWVAKLRDHKTDNNMLFLDTNMDAGHGGASGRFESLKETAKEYAFILDLEGITK